MNGIDPSCPIWWEDSRQGLQDHLRSSMEFLSFKSCLADPDVWMRPAIKSDANTYYEDIVLYMDDALVVSENAESIL